MRLALFVRIVGILLLVAALVGGGQWYLAGPAPDHTSAEPGLSLSQALGGELAGFARADRPRVFRFPDDHGPHPAYRTEWWYYTGNLKAAAGRHFGFQLTFFRTALKAPTDRAGRTSAWATQEVYMAHFALSDVATQRFYAFQRLSRSALGLAGASAVPFRVWLEDWSVTGETAAEQPGSMQLSAEEQDVALDLRLTPDKPIVLQRPEWAESERCCGRSGFVLLFPHPSALSRRPSTGRRRVPGAGAELDGPGMEYQRAG